MKYKSVIFDLDGTLLDTLDGIAYSCNAVLDELGFPEHPVNSYKLFVGNGLLSLLGRITPENTEPHILKRGCQLFNVIYKDNYRRNCCPYEDVDAMLSECAKRGLSLAILSNKPDSFTQLFVDTFLSQHTFSLVYGQREGFAKKPDPDVALTIARKLKTTPAETLFVGDSGVDIMTGKNAGMTSVGVLWGFRSVTELSDHGAKILISKPLELIDYV